MSQNFLMLLTTRRMKRGETRVVAGSLLLRETKAETRDSEIEGTP